MIKNNKDNISNLKDISDIVKELDKYSKFLDKCNLIDILTKTVITDIEDKKHQNVWKLLSSFFIPVSNPIGRKKTFVDSWNLKSNSNNNKNEFLKKFLYFSYGDLFSFAKKHFKKQDLHYLNIIKDCAETISHFEKIINDSTKGTNPYYIDDTSVVNGKLKAFKEEIHNKFSHIQVFQNLLFSRISNDGDIFYLNFVEILNSTKTEDNLNDNDSFLISPELLTNYNELKTKDQNTFVENLNDIRSNPFNNEVLSLIIEICHHFRELFRTHTQIGGANESEEESEKEYEEEYDPTAPNDYVQLQKERELKRSYARRFHGVGGTPRLLLQEPYGAARAARRVSAQERLAAEQKQNMQDYIDYLFYVHFYNYMEETEQNRLKSFLIDFFKDQLNTTDVSTNYNHKKECHYYKIIENMINFLISYYNFTIHFDVTVVNKILEKVFYSLNNLSNKYLDDISCYDLVFEEYSNYFSETILFIIENLDINENNTFEWITDTYTIQQNEFTHDDTPLDFRTHSNNNFQFNWVTLNKFERDIARNSQHDYILENDLSEDEKDDYNELKTSLNIKNIIYHKGFHYLIKNYGVGIDNEKIIIGINSDSFIMFPSGLDDTPGTSPPGTLPPGTPGRGITSTSTLQVTPGSLPPATPGLPATPGRGGTSTPSVTQGGNFITKKKMKTKKRLKIKKLKSKIKK